MDLMYMNHDREDLGMLKNPEFDLAFGENENNFECKISLKDHCCKEGYYIYAEGTEYGGIVDAIEIDSENDLAIYTGRSWHGILASKVIEPLKSTDEDVYIDGETIIPEKRLPDGYTELDSIISTGTQRIDTDFCPDADTKIVVELEYTKTGAQYSGLNMSSSYFMFGMNARLEIYMGDKVVVTPIAATTEKLEIILDAPNKTATINGTVIDIPYTTFTARQLTLPIFALRSDNSYSSYSNIRLYKYKIYHKNILVRDYVPCKNPSSNIGLYDLVYAKFYGNAGTGSFTAGNAISTDPITNQLLVTALSRTDIDGNSLVNRQLVITGDAGYCTKYIVDRIDLAPLFVTPENLTNVRITEYPFERYTDAYSGLRDMLTTCGMRLAVVCEENTVKISAVPIFDGSDGKEMESDLIDYQMKKTYNNVNHLICMGSGSYAERQIVHLYLDENGNVSETQTFTGIEERIQFDGEQDEPEETEEAKTAEQLAEERAQLIENGTKKLLDLQADDEIDVSFDSADDIYYIGDIVGAYDSVTDISVAAEVVKKILSIKNGKANIEYKVGARNG